jgi:hypothetical protein
LEISELNRFINEKSQDTIHDTNGFDVIKPLPAHVSVMVAEV